LKWEATKEEGEKRKEAIGMGGSGKRNREAHVISLTRPPITKPFLITLFPFCLIFSKGTQHTLFQTTLPNPRS